MVILQTTLMRNEEVSVLEWKSYPGEIILGLFLRIFRMSYLLTFHCPRQEVCGTDSEQSSG